MTGNSENQSLKRIAVIVSTFNRKAITLAGLESLFSQKGLEDIELTVYLVDDGSTDGTADAVASLFPQVHLLHGNGSLWWVGAMRMGIAAAMAENYDAYIWWNDDTKLMEDSVKRLVSAYESIRAQRGPAIVVGSICDKATGERTNGGWNKRPSGLRLDFDAVQPHASEPVLCDTMNGNFTLIPAPIAHDIGNMEPKFLHRWADWDYGLRASAKGWPIFLAPGFLGYCSANPMANTWRDGNISLGARWKDLMSPRGSIPAEWLLYTRRHFGWRWPLYFVSPYVRVLFK